MSDEIQGNNQGPVENRQHPRVQVATQVNFAVVVPVYEHGTSKDISQGGLCLETNKSLAQGSILRLEFDLPGERRGFWPLPQALTRIAAPAWVHIHCRTPSRFTRHCHSFLEDEWVFTGHY